MINNLVIIGKTYSYVPVKDETVYVIWIIFIKFQQYLSMISRLLQLNSGTLKNITTYKTTKNIHIKNNPHFGDFFFYIYTFLFKHLTFLFIHWFQKDKTQTFSLTFHLNWSHPLIKSYNFIIFTKFTRYYMSIIVRWLINLQR